MERHLASCAECTERLRWLAPAVDVLPETVPRAEAPPAVRERLMAQVRSEAASRSAAQAPAARRPRRRFAGFLMRPAVGLAAAAIVVVAGIAGYAIGNGDGEETDRFANENMELERKGDSGTLELTGVPEPPEGRVYQAWVEHDGEIEPSSLFAPRANGTASAAIPAELDGADEVMVTLEPQGGSTEPTGLPLMSLPLE